MVKVSTVILTYNSKDYIKPCLEALFSSKRNSKGDSKGDFKLSAIVVDNNSPDGTSAFLKLSRSDLNSLRMRFIQSKENNGFAAGVNIGIRKALKDNPNYIFLLNPDTKIQTDSIVSLLDGIKNYESRIKNAKVGIVGAQMIYSSGIPQGTFGNFPSFFTEILQKTRLYKIFPFGRFIPYNRFSKKYFKEIIPVDWVSGGAMMIKREVIEKIGLFDENYFMYIEDIDFCRRAREAGFEVIYNPEAKIWHKLGASSGSARITNDARLARRESKRELRITNFISKITRKIKNPAKIWQKESLAYYFKKWKSGLPEVVCRNTKYHLEPAGYTKLKFILNAINHYVLRSSTSETSEVELRRFPLKTSENTEKNNLTISQFNSLRILDIGCGNGNISFALAAAGYSVVGIDIHGDLIQKLKIKSQNLGMSNINFFEVDADNLSQLLNEKFDVIIMSEVLEHLKNPLITLQDAKKLLNQNGAIIATIPNKFSFEEGIRKSILRNNFLVKLKNKIKNKMSVSVQSTHDTPHLHFFSYGDFIKLAKKAGFDIVNSRPQSSGFKSFYYILGRFILSRKSPWFCRLDRFDGFLARFVPTHFGDGMMFVIKKAPNKFREC